MALLTNQVLLHPSSALKLLPSLRITPRCIQPACRVNPILDFKTLLLHFIYQPCEGQAFSVHVTRRPRQKLRQAKF